MTDTADHTPAEVDADTVANRAAQVISSMGAEIRALRQERNRYRNAWHNARSRAAGAQADVEFVEQRAAAVSAVVPAADRAAEDLAKHVARAIYALKSPTPPGSEHYRSGWDDGLEAAMDAARDAVLRLAAVPVVGVAADTTSAAERPRCPDCGLPHDLTPSMAIACASIRSMVDTVAPAVEPGPMVPAQPGNDTKTPRRCPHPVDEHSVYGCVDGCGCEWMPRRTPQ